MGRTIYVNLPVADLAERFGGGVGEITRPLRGLALRRIWVDRLDLTYQPAQGPTRYARWFHAG